MICTNVAPLEGNKIAPPLELGKDYPILRVIKDSKGNEHYDVGLKSQYGYITSWDVKGEELPESGPGETHWCHPSRFLHKAEELVPKDEQSLPLEGLYNADHI